MHKTIEDNGTTFKDQQLDMAVSLFNPYGPISSTQYMDFVEIFNISLDLSTIYMYFAHFSGH